MRCPKWANRGEADGFIHAEMESACLNGRHILLSYLSAFLTTKRIIYEPYTVTTPNFYAHDL